MSENATTSEAHAQLAKALSKIELLEEAIVLMMAMPSDRYLRREMKRIGREALRQVSE